MRLISRIMLNTTVVLAVGLSVWSVVFYYVMKDRGWCGRRMQL